MGVKVLQINVDRVRAAHGTARDVAESMDMHLVLLQEPNREIFEMTYCVVDVGMNDAKFYNFLYRDYFSLS